MQQIALSSNNAAKILETACQILEQGGLIVYPTETLYGVAVDATNPEAVSKLLAFKNRPAGKAISVLVADSEAAEKLVIRNNTALQIYQTYLPGPVTVVSKSRHLVDQRLESELGSLAIRISSHPFASALAREFAKPLSATSANASGKARPYTIQTCLAGLSEQQKSLIDLIIDAGQLPPNEPSSVIDTTQEVQEVVRAGSLAGKFLEQITSLSPEETELLGERLTKAWSHVIPYRPVVFCLLGPLGAGKTQFTKGVAKALGISETVTSPSYTLVKHYPGLLHADLWRTPEITASEIGLDEFLVPGNVVVIEWASPLLEYIKTKSEAVSYIISLEPSSETGRFINVSEL